MVRIAEDTWSAERSRASDGGNWSRDRGKCCNFGLWNRQVKHTCVFNLCLMSKVPYLQVFISFGHKMWTLTKENLVKMNWKFPWIWLNTAVKGHLFTDRWQNVMQLKWSIIPKLVDDSLSCPIKATRTFDSRQTRCTMILWHWKIQIFLAPTHYRKCPNRPKLILYQVFTQKSGEISVMITAASYWFLDREKCNLRSIHTNDHCFVGKKDGQPLIRPPMAGKTFLSIVKRVIYTWQRHCQVHAQTMGAAC